MSYLKLSLAGLLVVTFCGVISCSEAGINKQLTAPEINEQVNKTLEAVVKNVTNTRSGRALFSPNRMPGFTIRQRQPIQIRARADHLPLRTQMRRVYGNLPNGQPQRFGYESLKSSKYMAPAKGSNLPFPNNGKGGAFMSQMMAGHPNAIQPAALSQQYIHNFKASPAFNGQVVVHPAAQQQSTAAQQDNSYSQQINSQSSPQQPATVALSAQLPPQQQQQQQQAHQQNQPLTKYSELKQYPIPDLEKIQKYNEQHEKYMQHQKFLAPKTVPIYYQIQHNQQQHQELSPSPSSPKSSASGQPHQQQQQQKYAVQQPLLQYVPQQQKKQQQQPSIPIHESTQNNNNNNKAISRSVPPKMYSVHEENDMTDMQKINYQITALQDMDKEAKDYLRFMNTDEYFLPKKEPNYKGLDNENYKLQYNSIRGQPQQVLHSAPQTQALTQYQQLQPHKGPYHQQGYAASSLKQKPQHHSNSIYSNTPEAAAYHQGLPISRYFYHQNPAAAAGPAPATVVGSSYQAGYNQNQFIVNSQDKKFAKFTILPPIASNSIAISTPSPVVYTQLRYNTAAERTPEPLRFEFTERDAMVGASPYTHAPQAQLGYKEDADDDSATAIVPSAESSTISSLKIQNYGAVNAKQAVKPVVEEVEDDDPEEGDDIQEETNEVYGRQPLEKIDSQTSKTANATTTPSTEQYDTEEYCERICAIVEDENEEVICGSDGYMYTSEAQMECYSSCLRIDVTIQAKGSCSKR